MFQGCFKEVSRVFQTSFYRFSKSVKVVSRKIERCFNGVLSGFQVYMKEVQRVFEGSFKYVLRKFQGNLRKFQLCFKKD